MRMMRVWPLMQRRSKYGAYGLLMAELANSDTTQYHGFIRLTVEDELSSMMTITQLQSVRHFRFAKLSRGITDVVTRRDWPEPLELFQDLHMYRLVR